MGLIDRVGLVQYHSLKLPERVGTCELCPPKNTYFDHCHEHGWIRGELCSSHNGRMQFIDAETRQDLWEDWMLMHWLKCPDCAATSARALAVEPLPPSPEEARLALAELLANAFPRRRRGVEAEKTRWEALLRHAG